MICEDRAAASAPRNQRALAAVVLTSLFVADLLATLSADSGIHAPWSGLLVAALAGLLLALGAVARYWGIGLAIVASAAAVLGWWYGSAWPEPSGDCARECGIPLLAFLALVVPLAALFATVGAILGGAWQRRRLSRQDASGGNPRHI